MMMPDPDAANAKIELELAELVGLIGNRYTRAGLTPPFNLRDAVKHWRGLTADEIVAVLERHFSDSRHLYTCGAAEQHFGMVHQAMRQALESKRPHPFEREPDRDRPQRPRRRVVSLHNPSGFADVYVEGPAGPVREPEGPIEAPTALPGYEAAGEPIEDNGAGA
jgi:hypothetical protein